MVKVRCGEGVAIHTDPESCAGHCREAVREALIAGRTGEVLSGECSQGCRCRRGKQKATGTGPCVYRKFKPGRRSGDGVRLGWGTI